jgi:starch-binding outer membrane protein, SusD/RagB family
MKTMKVLRILAVAVVFGTGAAGCNDDFLTTVPSDRISDAVYWATEQDFNQAVTAAYRDILKLDQIYMDGLTDISYSQMYWMRNSLYQRGIHNALTDWHASIWADMYRGIARANEVLYRLERTDVLSADAKTRIEGQARFLRGHYYHELLWLFGGVPLVTAPITAEEARVATRASRAEVYAQIMADLTAAAVLLPASWNAANRGRATKGAALAYKARNALYEASYQKYALNGDGTAMFREAVTAAQEVMGLGLYGLHPDYLGLFQYSGNKTNVEPIFYHSVLKGQNNWNAIVNLAASTMGGNTSLTPTRALVDMYRMANGKAIHEADSGYDPAPPVINYVGTVPTVESLGMYANRDPRLSATVLFPGAINLNGTVYNSYPGCGTSGAHVPGGAADGYCSLTGDRLDYGNFYNTHTGYTVRKYTDPADLAAPANCGLDIIKMRYADVLLMYAEAKIELGERDASVNAALNAVRSRVDMPQVDVTAMAQADAIALVRNERVVELAFEGLRAADIRRWRAAEHVMPGRALGMSFYDKLGALVNAQGDVDIVFRAPRDYLWPLPASEVTLNPNLQQNPGY